MRTRLTGRPELLAASLLGGVLSAWRDGAMVSLRIVEVEAYGGPGEDPGSHAHRGMRRRNATMFAEPGRLYVYLSYGLHLCANVVCHEGSAGAAGAVLLRAGRVELGLEHARARTPTALADAGLASGPGRLGRALGLALSDDGTDLLAVPSTRVGAGLGLQLGRRPARVMSGPRVGVAGAGAQLPWRFWDAEAPEVSAYRAWSPRRRAVPGRRPGQDGSAPVGRRIEGTSR